MKQRRNALINSKLLMALFVALMSIYAVQAQVVVPFKQRTAAETPNQKVYNIKGDFQMIGNTNLTLSSYADDANNNTNMVYVDVDGENNTVNSSSATLQFSNENGALPDCSEIVYAGLYWTGRAHDGGTSPESFAINIPGGNYRNSESVRGYTLTIASENDNTNNTSGSDRRVATYTFTPTGGGDKVIFKFYSWKTTFLWATYHEKVTVKVGNGAETLLYETSNTDSSNSKTASFSEYTIGTGDNQFNIKSLTKHRTANTINNNFYSTINFPKQLNKRVVKLKHAGGSYQTITALPNDIYYPTTAHGQMYSAYAEVTDYVRAHGLGEYFVADMALTEGNGGNTGYYGGWGMIVVYENSKMKWRDITIFDGHAYVAGSTTVNHELEISGFHTAQNGQIEMKLGLIAGEGDTSISGDYFEIQRLNTSTWQRLSHAGNSSGNFFNGSIPSSAPRNPSLKNNTGIDIAMFNINNTNNSIIANNQTSTKFKYGSTQDTYIISCIAMAVDAYVPEVESFNKATKVNGATVGSSYTVKPGDEVEFTLEIKNRGSEAISNAAVEVQIPFTGVFKSATATYNKTPAGQQPTHTGNPGVITWNIGSLPKPANPDQVLATMTYKIMITDNCALLANAACASFAINGKTTAKGAVSGANYTSNRLVSGYQMDGNCVGEPIFKPVSLIINTDDYFAENCDTAPGAYKIELEYCDIEAVPMEGDNGVKIKFPVGTRFYSAIETFVEDDQTYVRAAAGATEYTTANPFPKKEDQGAQTYYAIPPGYNVTCFWEFTIKVDKYCGNFWYGNVDNNWGNAANWTAQQVPATGEDVEFATTLNNKNKPALKDLHLDTDRTIGSLINDTERNVVVKTSTQLKINGTVQDNNPTYGTIIVESKADEPSGTLLFGTTTGNSNVDATVQFYNKAYTCTTCGPTAHQQWQYFGIPVKQSATSMLMPNGISINQWSEPAFGNKWIGAPNQMTAFTGYEINDASSASPAAIYNFSGKLNVGDKSLSLTKTTGVNYAGRNLIGNSFTAAIPINASTITFSGNWDSAVYLFNAGSRNEWRKLSGHNVQGVESGRYLSVPVNTGGNAGLPDRIPSMHAFMLNTTSAGTLTLKYANLIKNTLVNNMAWRSATRTNEVMPYVVMDVVGTKSADRVWVFENITATRSMDAGWDGEKIMEPSLVQLYVTGDDHKFQVATVPQLQGTTLGMSPDGNESFKISFAVPQEVESRNLHLRDLITGRAYPIRNNVEYSVAGTGGTMDSRFRIIAAGEGNVVEQYGGKSPVDIFVINGQIGIANQTGAECVATVFDITGRVVTKKTVAEGTTQYLSGNGMNGVYVVKVEGKATSESKRVILR